MGQQELVQLRSLHRTAPPVAERHQARPVPGDGAQPSAELSRVRQLRQRLERQEKGILGHVFGSRAGTGHLLGDGNYCASEPADQLIEGRQVADERPDDQLFVRDVGKMAFGTHRFSRFQIEESG